MNATRPLYKRRWFQISILLVALVLVPFYFLDYEKWSDTAPAVAAYVRKSAEVERVLGRVESVQPKADARQSIRAGLAQGTARGTYSVVGSKDRGEIEVQLSWDGSEWRVTQATLLASGKQLDLTKDQAKP